MIVNRLMGGIGNQMFQWAFARNLSLKLNTDIKIDLSFLKRRDMGIGFTYRDYDLDIFNIESNFYTNEKIDYFLQEPHFHYVEDIFNKIKITPDKNILLSGYWQCEKYFKSIEDIIRQDFTFKNKIEDSNNNKLKENLEKIKSSNSVLINIRRKEFVNNTHHGCIGVEHVNNSVNIIQSKIENPTYFIFSDDIEWCRNNIKLDNMIVMDDYYLPDMGAKFNYYMQLMSSCKHFIIPNSSFAWWTAWLSENVDKIVITPKNWLLNKSINTNDVIPENWLKI